MTAANSTDSIAENPHFNDISRAPYELGRLLQKLPEDFSCHSKQTYSPDMQLIAKAAALHARNANETLMNGLHALGQVIVIAANNTDFSEIDSDNLMSLGSLISHLSVEARFLQETQSKLEFTLQELAKKPRAVA